MKLIESKTLGSAQAAIEFTSIPAAFTDLVIVFSLRTTFTNGSFRFDDCGLRINGDTGNNYARRLLRTRDGAVATGGGTTSLITLYEATGGDGTANAFGSGQIYFANYLGSANKSVSIEGFSETNSATGVQGGMISGLWSNTSPITSVTIFSQNAFNFAIGSSASLYGILKGSDGIVTTSP
jgi:hypothetical protein